MKKFQLKSGFLTGIHKKYPGSGYIDFHNDNLFVFLNLQPLIHQYEVYYILFLNHFHIECVEIVEFLFFVEYNKIFS